VIKKKIYFIFIAFLFFFFFYNVNEVSASDVFIIEYPVASDISYGKPLFESTLTGGKASVEGVFSFKNNTDTFQVGTHSVGVVFTPNDDTYNKVEINIDVEVTKRRVHVKFEQDLSKQYDGSKLLKLPEYLVLGILDSDDVYVRGNLEAELDNVLIGYNNVLLSGLELVGEKKDNYYLDLEGHIACVHPKFVEKFGNIKHKIEFGEDIYVPLNSVMFVEKIESNLNKKKFDIKHVYDIYLKSDDNVIVVDKEVKIKIKIDKSDLNYNRMHVYNYYDGKYEELDYVYKDGYIEYKASCLGDLVIAQKKLSFWWIYMLGSIVVLLVLVFVIVKLPKKHEKFNKYKSLKRSKEYGDY